MARLVGNFLLFSMVAILLGGCHLFEHDRDFDYGRVQQSVYKNDFFAMSIKLPPGWRVQTKSQLDSIHLRKAESFILPGHTVKASEVTSATLLTVCKFGSDTFFDFNPTMSIQVERIGQQSGTKSARDYLASAQRMLKRSPMHYEMIDSISREVIGGRLFYRLRAQVSKGQLDIAQDFYSILADGFSFNFILTSSNEEDWQQLRQIISTADFEKKDE